MANKKTARRTVNKVKKDGNKIYIKPNSKTGVQVRVKKHPILHRIIRENWDMYINDYKKATKNIEDGQVTIEQLPIYLIPEAQFEVLQKEVKTQDFQIVLYMNNTVNTWVVLRVKRKYSIIQRVSMWWSNIWAKLKGAKSGTIYMDDEAK